MKITKKDYLSGYIAQALNIGYGLLLLPFMLIYLNEAEVAYWLILLAFIGLISVFDFGFSPTITRAVSYAMSGADALKAQGFDKLTQVKKQPNWQLLLELNNAVKVVYAWIALIALILMGIFGTFYIDSFLARNPIENGHLIWYIFLVGFIINLYFLYAFPILMGMHKIFQANIINIIMRSLWLILSVIGLIVFKSLWVLPLAYFLGIIIARIYSIYIIHQILKDKSIGISTQNKSIIKTLIPNSWRLGIVMIGSFLINKATIFIAGLYLLASEISSYALTLQLLSVLITFSQVYFATHIPQLSSQRINASPMLQSNYYKLLATTLGIYIILAMGIFFLGNDILSLIGSHVYLVSNTLLMFILLFGLLELNHSLAATFITTGNDVPFVLASICSGMAIIIGALSIFEFNQPSLIVLIVLQGLVQLSYNNWKWPLEVNRIMQGLKHG